MQAYYPLLADLVLLLHALIVVFIVLSLVLIIIGGQRQWAWIGNPWFRVTHLVAIAIVVAQAWLGRLCPLTILEAWLRAPDAAPQQSFMQYWLQQLLYYDLPLWMFGVAYTLFGILVVLAWRWYPPKFR